MTFRSLPVGARFEFESARTMPFSGMMRGPWIKTSARGYRTDPDNGLKYRVGSINVKVDRLDAGNPRVKLPANWTPAQVRVLPTGDLQIGLSQNPLSAKGGRFAKCVKTVEAKGGAYDPRAVCGAMEKRAHNPIEYRFVDEGGGRGYYVSTRKRPGKGRVVSLPRGYVKDPDGVYRKRRRKNGKRRTLKRVRRALAKYIRGNPGTMRTFQVDVPKTRYDKGYRLTIKAKTKASARAEAKRYCADSFHKYTGKPASQYRLPSKTRVVEI